MPAPPACGTGNRRADHVDELSRRCERTRVDDPSRDPARVSLFAVAGDQLGELFLFVAVHDVGGGQRLPGVHAHVERRVEPVREAALGPVELRTAHPQVHQDPHDRFSPAVPLDQLGELLETTLDDLHPRPEGSEPETSSGDGVGVTVDPEQADVGSSLEQRRRMATTTDGAIDDQSVRHGEEELHHLPDHHREMRERRLHIRLLEPCCRSRTSRRPRLQPPGRQEPPGMSPQVGNG